MDSEQSKLFSYSPTRGFLIPFLDWILVFLVTGIVSILYSWNKSTSDRDKASYVNEFPGPKALPIIGNGHQMLFKPTEFYSWSWSLCRRWGDLMRLWRLNIPVFLVSSYEAANFLLSKSNFVAKSQDINLFWRQPGGNGLSSTPAHIHRSRRKLLYPGYLKSVVERSIYVFSEESRRLVGKLLPYADNGERFELMELLMPCSFHIICRSAFGDGQMEKRSDAKALEQMHALHTIGKNFTTRIMSPKFWLRNDFIYFNLTSEGRKCKEYMKIINGFGAESINQRRRERNESGKEPETATQQCYLDLLLDLQEKGDLDECDLLGELNNYIAAGYDTTALAIGWTLFALAINPRCHQDRIYEEVKAILGDNEISAADTKEMKYLELCIKEAMRLYPTSPVLPRSTTDDMSLPDGRLIPAGSEVLIMIDMIHRDPKWFPQPDEFIPQRHLERIPAFLPFSAGARNCIGQLYAMHQIKVELAYLLQEFIWETNERPDTIPRLFQALMVPAEGIHFKISRRKSYVDD